MVDLPLLVTHDLRLVNISIAFFSPRYRTMENVVHVGGRSNIGVPQSQRRKRGHLLCLNAGSSSLKFKLFDLSNDPQPTTLEALVQGSIKLKQNQAKLELLHHDGSSQTTTKPWDNIASSEVLECLLASISELLAEKVQLDIRTISHRVVHGAHLAQCVSITRRDQHHLKTLQFLAEFAPLHNAVSVQLIRACLSTKMLEDDCDHVCCFDTAFHSTLDEARSQYMVDKRLAGTSLPGGMELRKWGFHGLSYESILHTLEKDMARERSGLNIIICHLGSGSSMCAVVGGKSFDTTMGLTPLEGLPGATRSGSVDPVLPLHISASGDERDKQDPFSSIEVAQGIYVSRAELILNKQSGFKAIAGTSDFEQVCHQRSEFIRDKPSSRWTGDNPHPGQAASLAFDIFIDRIVGYLGSYAAKMSSRGGVHAVVFSGGVGEASADLHAELARLMDYSSLSPAQDAVPAGKSKHCWQLSRKALGLEPTTRSMSAGQSVPWFVCKVR